MSHRTGQAGLTLVELLVVIIIIAIVGSLALMQRGSANEQFQRQNAARELKTAFERARFDSVKRRADGTTQAPFANVVVAATQLTLVLDANQDGDISDAVDSVSIATPAGVFYAARTGLTLPVTVSFNRRGEPDISDATFLACIGTCDLNNDTPATADIIHVTATGTVNMLPGGSEIPSFTAPAVSAVPSGSGIRSETYIAP